MSNRQPFILLHLSDLHAGLTSQSMLWPNVKEVFFKDLASMHKQLGRFDAVLFSGDFAQIGDDAEFDEVVGRLREIWLHLNEMGSNPQVICIPGNHDIKRPNPKSSTVRMLSKWVEEPDVIDDVFEGKDDPYFKTISDAFSGYDRFIKELSQTSIPMAEHRTGFLPGDQLVRVRGGDFTIGLLGLNSTWLQLTAEDHFGRLCVDQRQVFRLEPDLASWCDTVDFRVIVTHQPLDWLSPKSVEVWRREIDPPGRFDIHLFGHMHEPFSESKAESGAGTRHAMQAPSLFGMEKLADGQTVRIHGYSVIEFGSDDEEPRIRIFPRRVKNHASGQQRFVANDDFILEEDKYFVVRLKGRDLAPPLPLSFPTAKTFDAADEESRNRDILRPLDYHLRFSKSHLRVRHAEQEQCQYALQSSRWLWLTSEWGLGSDEFLASVIKRNLGAHRICRLDTSEYADKDSFGADIAQKLSCSFAQFCDALASEPTLLILDDIEAGSGLAPGALPLEKDVESFVEVLLDASPSLCVVMRTLRKPSHTSAPALQLARLDEADVKLYVGDHELGGSQLTGFDPVTILYRHTDGYPTRLDARLKELAVVSILDLSSGDDEAFSETREESKAPPILTKAFRDLSTAGDKNTKRMHDMLLALIVFPQGAELGRIKRFNGVHPFHPADAVGLLDRGLITISELPEVGASDTSMPQKVMVVPRPIRDFVRTQVSDEVIERLNRRAAELLFGEDWMSGSTSWPPYADYSSPRCGAAEIANAGALLLRQFRKHKDDPTSRVAVSVVSLAALLARALCDGCHYSSAANFCRDFVSLMNKEDFPDKRSHLIRHYGYALRMIGETTRAKEQLLEALAYSFPKSIQQNVMMDLAFCHETLGEMDEAIAYAKNVLKINKKNELAIQATAMIVEQETREPERTRALVALEQAARRRNLHTAADNISLTLARETENDHEAAALLSKVLKPGRRSKDFYNTARAILEIVNRKIDAGESISDSEVADLVTCYQFVLSERIPWMFQKCNKALWHVFEIKREWENMLTLFRYSSMIWRLRGEEDVEKLYLDKLTAAVEKLPLAAVRMNKVSSYYFSRQAHHNGNTKALAAPV